MLFTEGALRLQQSGLQALDFFQNVDADYGGVDVPLVTDANRVQVPQNNVLLTEDEYSRLSQAIDPLSQSPNYGIDLYEQAVQFITALYI